MSTLKERFDNYSVTPDEKVWEGISQAMNHKRLVRRRTVVASSVAAVAALTVAAVILLNNLSTPETPTASQQVAELQVAAQPTQVSELEPTTVAEDGAVISQQTENVPAADVVLADNNTAMDAPLPVVPTMATPVLPNDVSNAVMPSVTTPSPKPSTPTTVPTHNAASTATAADNRTAPATDGGSGTTTPNSVGAKAPQVNSVTKPDELVVWIPNAFSPDDPSADDRIRQFKVYPNGGADIISFEIFIYSRAGRLVYHSKDLNEAWDGTANGHAQPMGTYVYIIEINDSAKGIQHTRGTITLVR